MRCGFVSLLVQVQAAKINDDVYPQFCKALKTKIGRLRSAEESWRDLAKIRHTRETDSLGWRVRNRGILSLRLGLERWNRRAHAESDDHYSSKAVNLLRYSHKN